MTTERIESMCGGKGHVIINHILSEKELNGKCDLYAEVILEPGCEVGYHTHSKESETYYILSGTGLYNDNGKTRTVGKGDITFTPDGCGHSLENTGNQNLVFMALIVLD